MKALVTGGAGFIGSHVIRSLQKRGTEVRTLVLPGENTINLRDLDVEQVQGNVLDAEAIKRAVAGCDQVYHLAAIYALWLPDMNLIRRVNVEGTENVLTAARDAGVSKVVFTSSIAAFSGGANPIATEESSFELGGTGNLYSQTKYESQQLALRFAKEGMDISIVAPCPPIGPGDLGPTPTGRLVLSVVNLPIGLVTDAWTNAVDVRDVAEGHVLAAEKGKSGECYLLGNQNLTLGEMAGMIMDVVGIKKLAIPLPGKALVMAGGVMGAWSKYVSHKPPLMTADSARVSNLGLRADCTKAFTELNLPKRPVQESLRDALIWFAENGYIRSKRVRKHLIGHA